MFEYDPAKSAANRLKHGIDFEEAQEIWDDPNVIEYPSDRRVEERYLVIGRIGVQYWTAIVAYRDESVRIISVRRSRDNEKEAYNSFRIREEI